MIQLETTIHLQNIILGPALGGATRLKSCALRLLSISPWVLTMQIEEYAQEQLVARLSILVRMPYSMQALIKTITNNNECARTISKCH